MINMCSALQLYGNALYSLSKLLLRNGHKRFYWYRIISTFRGLLKCYELNAMIYIPYTFWFCRIYLFQNGCYLNSGFNIYFRVLRWFYMLLGVT